MKEREKDWFDEWFDTHYYHILYKHRNYEEAAMFIDNLVAKYDIPQGANVLDLACGKGRHSIYLNKKGLDVTGVDLSFNNIQHANQFANDSLRFAIHDMRDVYSPDRFDYIFNLFTSFGYFDTKEENLDVIEATVASLKSNGLFILDFLNPYVVVNKLVKCEQKIIDGVEFEIEREYTEDDYIKKSIKINDGGKEYAFYEKVKAIRREDFITYFEKQNLEVLDQYGDYYLTPYDSAVSDRLIFVIRKP
ncbi:SAM-dependent methyltransferase [Reichenbachiella versicolor]|uniref:SAM-dependent methyltransferase n=1 Tax=Reichenbachiella versicolor TaxID=1821036 RepID=UPI000D6E8C95|nr:class I SAM-dependent methyltransferase [Reichenbachiella versicolor]